MNGIGSFVKNTLHSSYQRIIATICFILLVICNQRLITVVWYQQNYFCDCVGIIMAVLVMTSYRWADFVKYRLPYIIWSALCVIGLPVAVVIVSKTRGLIPDNIILALCVFLWGICLIHTVIDLFIEKNRNRLFIPLFAVWAVMMFLMTIANTSYIWPGFYFFMFLIYYITPQKQGNRSEIYLGMLDGLVIGFILNQGFSLLFRPYDQVRYLGNFSNPNHNSLYMVIWLGAIYGRILLSIARKEKIVWRILLFVLSGIVHALNFMTACRTGFIAAIIVSILFVIGYCVIRHKKMFFRMGAAALLIFIVMTPVTYFAVRYFPLTNPYVVFYDFDNHNAHDVHRENKKDPANYVTFMQMLDSSLGRLMDLVKKNNVNEVEAAETDNMIAGEADGVQITEQTAELLTDMPADGAEQPRDYIYEDENNTIAVRTTIYKWYLEHLTLRGVPNTPEYQGFQLTPGRWLQSPHNIYLFYGINFGIPVMILFAVLIVWGNIRTLINFFKRKDVLLIVVLLLSCIVPVFGMFEEAWGSGALSTTILYLTFREFVLKNPSEGEIITTAGKQ